MTKADAENILSRRDRLALGIAILSRAHIADAGSFGEQLLAMPVPWIQLRSRILVLWRHLTNLFAGRDGRGQIV